ncbi:hypothetical protein [Anoxynatronum sibiricum]|uniref:Uncharacterized protein n=1 Tax=Anoxynatronum sibiricum TaxID=210623 RepID=A0ABU9VX42_9CLOT
MYTTTSLVGAILWMVPLMFIIWVNFRWHHRHGNIKWLKWFHVASVAAVVFLMTKLMIIAMLELPMRATHEKVQWVALALAMGALVKAGICCLTEETGQAQASQQSTPLEAVFQSMEDQVYIYDSAFRLSATNHGDIHCLKAAPVVDLRACLNQYEAEINPEQKAVLEDFFEHRKPHQSLKHFKIMIPSRKGYFILSKVFDEDEDWVGTVLLIHQAAEEIELIESIQEQNQQRLELNKKMEASLKKLEEFGYEKEKDRLLQAVNQSIIEATNQYIRDIQGIRRNQQITRKEKKERVANINQGVGELYKKLRLVVRQMVTKEKVTSND